MDKVKENILDRQKKKIKLLGDAQLFECVLFLWRKSPLWYQNTECID